MIQELKVEPGQELENARKHIAFIMGRLSNQDTHITGGWEAQTAMAQAQATLAVAKQLERLAELIQVRKPGDL